MNWNTPVICSFRNGLPNPAVRVIPSASDLTNPPPKLDSRQYLVNNNRPQHVTARNSIPSYSIPGLARDSSFIYLDLDRCITFI